MITVIFTCGHFQEVDGSGATPICVCGETKIARVDAPAPRFTGHCRGPHATYRDLEAKPVTFGSN